ncbi:MAG: type III pantothenate kinase, partial [Hydrogenobacter sp.]
GVFEGGFISLGLSTKLQCLSQRAELIPSFDLKKVEVFLGKDTQSAVVGGVLKEAKSFIKTLLEELKNTYMKDLSLIITGGDGWIFEDMGIYDPLLIHKAILRIHKLL